MRQDDIARILKLAAGNSFDVQMTDESSVRVTHRKCGHTFKCAIKEVAYRGFTCSRCSNVLKAEMLHTAEEAHSMELYQKCQQVLPMGFTIYGQTLSEDSIIRVSWPGGEDFDIKVSDLLAGRELPDCLLHRDNDLIPSIQLSILDLFIKDHLEILDDFYSLEDVIRIKNNSLGVVDSYAVRDVLKGIVERYDKDNKSSVKLLLE